jgi:hypothetical protein
LSRSTPVLDTGAADLWHDRGVVIRARHLPFQPLRVALGGRPNRPFQGLLREEVNTDA